VVVAPQVQQPLEVFLVGIHLLLVRQLLKVLLGLVLIRLNLMAVVVVEVM
jgi:hypothetical protein